MKLITVVICILFFVCCWRNAVVYLQACNLDWSRGLIARMIFWLFVCAFFEALAQVFIIGSFSVPQEYGSVIRRVCDIVYLTPLVMAFWVTYRKRFPCGSNNLPA